MNCARAQASTTLKLAAILKITCMRLTPQERTSLSLVLLIFILALIAYLLSKQGLYLSY